MPTESRPDDPIMLDSLRNFLSDLTGGEKHPARFEENDYRLAAAALLIHASTIDGTMTGPSATSCTRCSSRVLRSMTRATEELIDVGTLAENEAVDLYHFTSLINRSLDEAGRLGIVEMMWEIVFADGRVNEFEDNLMWRAADLLGVSSRDRIALRRRVAGEKAEQRRERLERISRRDTGFPSGMRQGTSGGDVDLQARHGGHRRLGRHRRGARARVRPQRPRGRAGGAAREGNGPAREPSSRCRPNTSRMSSSADLQRTDAPARIAHELLGRGLEPAIVVNNAGFGLHGPAAELDRGEQLAMIDLNVRALTDLSLRWIDGIVKHKGGILNVASVAGFLPGPGMAVYYASKAYVLSFTEALARELAAQACASPRSVPARCKTEFQMRAGIARKPPSPPARRAPPSRSRRPAMTASWPASAWSFRASATRS